MTTKRCIKDLCKFYFNSDNYYIYCHLARDCLIDDKCIGYKFIKSEKEKLAGQMSKISNEIYNLDVLAAIMEVK